MPIQFTSMITALVWTFSGRVYAMLFVVAGTFLRMDSLPILSGIQNIVSKVLPNGSPELTQSVTMCLMFAGNVCSAYLFKRILEHRFANRLPVVFFSSPRVAIESRAGGRGLGLPGLVAHGNSSLHPWMISAGVSVDSRDGEGKRVRIAGGQVT
jgi:hypothetical protein